MYRQLMIVAIVFASGCGTEDSVVLAFPHGGMTGADGLRAESAAKEALLERGVAVKLVNLDAGVANPHEDEGTDDERAIAAAARLPETLRRLGHVRGVLVGPTRAIADAVPWRKIHARIVAIAPLVREVPCVCKRESDLLQSDGSLLLSSGDGRSWMDRKHSHYSSLPVAVGNRSSFTVVNRLGFAYRVPPNSRAALMENPGALDLRSFSAAAHGLQALPNPSVDVAKQARRAVSGLLDTTEAKS
ncbi:MAG: hypothetical protein NVS4B5_01910 [Vulcanimicrobiaceae bacterium]